MILCQGKPLGGPLGLAAPEVALSVPWHYLSGPYKNSQVREVPE